MTELKFNSESQEWLKSEKRMAKKIEVSFIPLKKTEDISDNPMPPWCL